ncbi:MAG: hypothetical protein AAGK25_03055 [Pseudomonadota bacterium]
MGSSDRLAHSVQKLLKVARLEADRINADLAAIRVSRTSTETALAQLDHADLQERHRLEKMQAANPALAMNDAATNFVERSRIKRANMTATLDQLGTREEAAKTDLQTAYAEIKKLEHLIEISERKAGETARRAQDEVRTQMLSVRYGQSG